MTRSIAVNTPTRSYEVLVGQGVLAQAGEIVRAQCKGSNAFIVTDSNVRPLYADAVRGSLEDAGFAVATAEFTAGEASKRMGTWAGLLEAMAEVPLGRDDIVVALGGGVAGDMGGFAAASYMRGIPVVQVPTSLLAMVDSSVGGKTAIDLEAGKNLVGAFHQPSAVIADIRTLTSLSPELFTDSIGEVIKHGVLADPAMFDELAAEPLNAQPVAESLSRIERIVARNIEIKRDVVEQDETEKGLRQTLNLGHTLGHAIEAASNYELGHGSCVAAGLCIVARASAALGICKAETADRIVAAAAAHGLPTGTQLTASEVYRYALADKKRHASSINVVVPAAIGQCEVRKMTLNEFRAFLELGLEA